MVRFRRFADRTWGSGLVRYKHRFDVAVGRCFWLKARLRQHHIFPKNYLNSIGINRNVDRNQVANFVFIDYQSNIEISDRAPAEYLLEYRNRLGEEAFAETCEMNAIPSGLETMTYASFLKARRVLMAQMIKAAYLKLSGEVELRN